MSTHDNNNYDLDDLRMGTSFGYQRSTDDHNQKTNNMFIRKVKVVETSRFRDGGTISYQDQAGNEYYVDNRMYTETPNRITDRYPDLKGAIVENVELEIVDNFFNNATIA